MDEQQRNRPAHAEATAPQQEATRTDSERIARALEYLAENEKSADKEEGERRDLDAQEGAWRWAKWAAWLAFWQLALSGAGIWFVIRTLEQNRAALILARDTLTTENRAWLDLEVGIAPNIPLTWEKGPPDHIRLTVRHRARNHGSSPALNVEIHADIVFNPNAQAEIEKISASPQGGAFYPTVLFPGETSEWTGVNLPGRVGGPFYETSGVLMPTLIVYVTYRTIFDAPDSPRRCTIRVFDVRRELNHFITEDDCPVPPDRITVTASSINGGHIT